MKTAYESTLKLAKASGSFLRPGLAENPASAMCIPRLPAHCCGDFTFARGLRRLNMKGMGIWHQDHLQDGISSSYGCHRCDCRTVYNLARFAAATEC